jgi:hypothetical protein
MERRRRAFSASEAIAAAVVLVIVVVMVVFSIASIGNSSPCRDEPALIRAALEAFRSKHGAGAQPTMRQLVEDGDLFQESPRFTIEYRESSREPVLTPIVGGGC